MRFASVSKEPSSNMSSKWIPLTLHLTGNNPWYKKLLGRKNACNNLQTSKKAERCWVGMPHPSWTEVSFLVWTTTKTTSGSYSGSRRFRKMHFENILPRASWDRDSRYPMVVPWDQKNFLKKFLSQSYLGICRQVWGLVWVKSDFWPKKGYSRL